jgi:hypothetical protein
LLLAVIGDAYSNALQTEYTEEARQMSSTTNEVELEQYDTTSQTISIADRLPELSNEAFVDASEEDSVEWAQGMLQHYSPGSIHEMPSSGITLQIISEDTARCISIYDHGYCLFMLRMMIQTFEHAGLTLEVDPHTVLRPYEAPEEQEQEPEHVTPQAASSNDFAIEVV